MCIICLSLDNNWITIEEANEHYQDLRDDLNPDHAKEVGNLIWEKMEITSNYQPDWAFVAEEEQTDLMWLFEAED